MTSNTKHLSLFHRPRRLRRTPREILDKVGQSSSAIGLSL